LRLDTSTLERIRAAFLERNPGYATLGNSDAHEIEIVGACYTEFDAEIRTSADQWTGYVIETPRMCAHRCGRANRIRLLLPWKEMSMAGGDIAIEILKDIRDDIRGVRSGVHDVRAEVHDRTARQRPRVTRRQARNEVK